MAATITKTPVVLADNLTFTAGGAETFTAWYDATGWDYVEVAILSTNGATGPTVPPQYQIYRSGAANGANPIKMGGPLVALTGNSIPTPWSGIRVAAPSYIAVSVSAATGQNITYRIELDAYKKL